MRSTNYKHLHYFWVVTKSGGVAKAGEQLHVTPQSISGQIKLLEDAIGAPLWRRARRKLELTETGHRVLDYADRLFSVGDELKDTLRDRPGLASTQFRVGVSGAVVKVVAHKLIEPALRADRAGGLLCRERRFSELLALLAVHKLDLVLSDRPMHTSMNVRGFNHLLEECGVTFLAVAAQARKVRRGFPQRLDNAPMLPPGEDSSAIRPLLLRWLDKHNLRPPIVGDFDDTAVMKAFGSGAACVFAMPTSVAKETAAQFKMEVVGQTDEVLYQTYAISDERRLRHSAVVAISEAAPGVAS